MTVNKFFALTCLSCFALAATGCSDPADATAPETATAAAHDADGHGHSHGHDHGHGHSHDLPETYDDAVTAVAKFDETIKNAFAANDKDAAHGPLHEIGDVLEALQKLVEKADMTDEQRTSAKGAVEKLFDAFAAIDATMHDQEGKSYDELSTEIAENIAILKAVCSTKEESTDE